MEAGSAPTVHACLWAFPCRALVAVHIWAAAEANEATLSLGIPFWAEIGASLNGLIAPVPGKNNLEDNTLFVKTES